MAHVLINSRVFRLSHFGIFVVTLNIDWEVEHVLEGQLSLLAVLLELLIVDQLLALDLHLAHCEERHDD